MLCMNRPCFLVIDREFPGSISTRKLMIETAKFNVLTAYSGKEALEVFTRFPAVSGVVLTSSVTVAARSGPGLSGFDYAQIKAPVLLMHHTEDSCTYTPYRDARSIAQAQRYPLISVTGGKPASSDPCEAFSAHGFLGKEPETVEAMVNWMLKKPYRDNIN